MNRAAWGVAWRAARLTMGKRPLGAEAILAFAEAALGRRITLAEQCFALRCWQSRHYGPAEASFANARAKRFYALADLCRDRWSMQ